MPSDKQKRRICGMLFEHWSFLVNMVLNVHKNRKAYQGRGEGREVGMEVGEEGDYKIIPIASVTLSPPQ